MPAEALRTLPLLALGFRPFFLSAALSATLLMLLWLGILQAFLPAPEGYGAIGWHAHEMLFGYTCAVIAGFLLTATRNWSGVETAKGMPLLGLVLLWLSGRILPFIPMRPEWLVSGIDLAFLPLLGAALIKPLFADKITHNRMILVLLAVMTLANGLFHGAQLKLLDPALAWKGLYLMLDSVLLLILMIAGRIMPFFTEAAIPGAACKRVALAERGTVYLLFALLISDLAGSPLLTGSTALLLGILQAVRLAGWFHPRVLRIPILLVLHAGYGFLVIALLVRALAAAGLLSFSIAIHVYTVGGIGLITLGMMARVALGHTGRPMRAAKPMILAFFLIVLAVPFRTFLPVLIPSRHELWINISGGLWVVAFASYFIIYLPILCRKRIDGNPG